MLLALGTLVFGEAVIGRPDFQEGDMLSATVLNGHRAALQDR